MVLPEVTSPEAALTGSDVTEIHLTKTEIHMTGSDRVRMRNRFPRFCSYHISTNVSLRMTDMATGRVPLEGWGARMCNRKLRDILSNVTRRASPGKYGSAHARPEVPLWCDLICSQTQPKRIGMCYITNQSHHWKLNQFKK